MSTYLSVSTGEQPNEEQRKRLQALIDLAESDDSDLYEEELDDEAE